MKPCLLQTHQYLLPTWYRGRMCTLYGNQSGTSYGTFPGRYGGNRGTLYNNSRQTDYLNGYVAPNLGPIENLFPPISGFIPNAVIGDSFDSGVVVSVNHGPSMAPIQINSQEEAEMVFGAPVFAGAGPSGSFGFSMDAAQANLMAQTMSGQISEMGPRPPTPKEDKISNENGTDRR